jgi:transposase
MRILVATQPVDFRKGIDGLAAICRKQLEQDPMTGCPFVFRNRKGTAMKILLCDGQGDWLCQKRLSTGPFLHWPSGNSPTRALQAHQLQVLIAGSNTAVSQAPAAGRQRSAVGAGHSPSDGIHDLVPAPSKRAIIWFTLRTSREVVVGHFVQLRRGTPCGSGYSRTFTTMF